MTHLWNLAHLQVVRRQMVIFPSRGDHGGRIEFLEKEMGRAEQAFVETYWIHRPGGLEMVVGGEWYRNENPTVRYAVSRHEAIRYLAKHHPDAGRRWFREHCFMLN